MKGGYREERRGLGLRGRKRSGRVEGFLLGFWDGVLDHGLEVGLPVLLEDFSLPETALL